MSRRRTVHADREDLFLRACREPKDFRGMVPGDRIFLTETFQVPVAFPTAIALDGTRDQHPPV